MPHREELPNPSFTVSVHDSYPPEESALIDRGLGEANDTAAPLHEVRPLSCFARSESGQVVGGAVGRWWGPCCELQQLWVQSSHRRSGIGTQLVQAFEARARQQGCSIFYLETFNFQAPQLYESLGYTVAYEHKVYPHGIVKYVMVKRVASNQNAAIDEQAFLDALAVYLEAFAARDHARRLELLTASMTPDAEIWGPKRVFRGYQEISEKIEAFHQNWPDCRLVLASGLNTFLNAARFEGAIIGADGAIRASGHALIELVDDGRIQRVIPFWEPLPPLPATWPAQFAPGSNLARDA